MSFPPSAIILVNDDLTPNVKEMLQRQLLLNEIILKSTWDNRLSNNPLYPTLIKRDFKRLAVLSSFQEFPDRSDFDLALFIKAGLCSVEMNKFGPPGITFPVVNLYWGQLGIFHL